MNPQPEFGVKENAWDDLGYTKTRLGRGPVYTVSKICRDIKLLLESRFPQGVWIEGEISNLRMPSSGHVYFSLKDSEAVIHAVLFRGNALGVRFAPADGLKVLVFGTVSIYEGRGVYQVIVQRMEPQGLGAFQLALEQLKAKLQAEGLFDEARKKAIPMLVQRIAVVTSPTGAAIRDILHVLERRFSNLDIGIYPVAVQGSGAAQAMAQALRDINELGEFDVILVTRGGGSLEDLWAFNEEVLARAVAASHIPVISAVGHEVDYTLCDMVADMRCPTPTAAAEMVIAHKHDIEERLNVLWASTMTALENLVARMENRLQLALRSHGFVESTRLLESYLQKVDDALASMAGSLLHAWEMRKKDFQRVVEKLEALSPLAVLGRGYSITFWESSGRIIQRAQDVRIGEELRTILGKGKVFSTVTRAE